MRVEELELEKAKDIKFANIPQVIKDFVHNWRIKTEQWIRQNLEEYSKTRKEAYSYYEKAYDWSNNLTQEERKELLNKYNELYQEIKENTDPLIINIYSRGKDKEEYIQKLLNEEEENKILGLIKRVTKVIGTIIDASNLRISEQNGELNGLVIGKEGKAYIETIGAGGYAVQCFHYRVLVKKIKQ